MSRAEELREHARQLVEAVMKTDENISQEILQVVRADVHRLEFLACVLDEKENGKRFPICQTKKAAT